ncbi:MULTISPECIES: TetR/AcrR family transcriptional regulator [unclassified Saccharopolyspora]|uniref:TetR/AcrR family transcriptional regulator n=1 Tax=unclassified Saccharopolyspora TaxID=2646250 RepID=UPI001CD41E73|nr:MULTISPECIES: TetR/AcrR family transcriptional regulator [unclassified Saccharopolyspora]MCA1193501.1 TetR/AcrR family transcriptional regulator [Saccharopolyspora sp. 6V]MCA1227833.1 TetR/AcrR family transcriptional regulator [Saccharopolyspora sp. 6M]MCA1280504.1 TetR/AcrR family transcriptional regulator [Saccharopolyspora sp. 7B]
MSSGERRLRPRKTPRQVRAELTRERILTAAAHVFTEHGYAAGTTNRIAERARISIGSLYQYFPNKDAILVELLTKHLDEGIAATRAHLAAQRPASVEEEVRGFVRAAIANHLDDPKLLRVMFEQAPRSRELLEKIERLEQEHVTRARELIARYSEVRVGDPRTAARLVVSTVELVVHQLISSADPIDIPAFEDELTTMLTRYLTGGPLR